MNQMLKVNTALGSTDLDAVTADYTLERMVVKTCGAEYTGEYPNCLPNPTPVEMGADGSSSGFWGSSYVPPPPPEPDEVDLSGDTVPAGVIS